MKLGLFITAPGRLIVALFLALLWLPWFTHAAARPNIIFFITDDISPDDLGIYGNPFVQTPNLDRLADRSLVFDSAYLTTSSCSPSRCSIITGRYPHNTGAPELHTTLPADQATFVQALRQAGYHTLLSGKNHMGKPDQLGFDASSDSKPSGSENWVKHLRERPRGKPLFAWFASHDAHHPFQTNKLAPSYDPAKVPVPAMLFDGPGTRQELAAYYHEVSRTDHYVGELMKELENQGMVENTFFVYCSDNGRPFPRCKTYLYDSGIKTPLLAFGPGVKPGRSRSLVSSIDLAPTFLDLAGVKKPASVQGVSLVPILRDPAVSVREVAFAERNWHVFQVHQRMVRFGDWLYTWNAWPDRHNLSGESAWTNQFAAVAELWKAAADGKLNPQQALLTKATQPTEMFFNVKDDPHQFHNLADDRAHAAPLKQARALLEQWKSQTADSVPAEPTPDRGPVNIGPGGTVQRGDFPGASRNAAKINHPGPVHIPLDLYDNANR
jgi:arylsulfatase A-like enzyme